MPFYWSFISFYFIFLQVTSVFLKSSFIYTVLESAIYVHICIYIRCKHTYARLKWYHNCWFPRNHDVQIVKTLLYYIFFLLSLYWIYFVCCWNLCFFWIQCSHLKYIWNVYCKLLCWISLAQISNETCFSKKKTTNKTILTFECTCWHGI